MLKINKFTYKLYSVFKIENLDFIEEGINGSYQYF